METNKILAIGAAALIVGAGATAGIMNSSIVGMEDFTIEQANVILNLQEQVNVLKNLSPVIVTEFETVTEYVNQTVEVPVYVDNENLELVLDHIYDNDGNIEYLTEDLDNDEINLIVDRIIFINEIKSLAVAEVEEEFTDLIDKEEFKFNNEIIIFDEDDVERVRVQDDGDDIIIEDVDFEDSDADVLVEVRFEQDDVRYVATCKVEFKDGEVDDLDLESVVLRD